MTDDHHLLELAAKAVGYEYYWVDSVGGSGLLQVSKPGSNWAKSWDPLTNDGDAFQLAVKLKITVEQNILETAVCAYVKVGNIRQHFVSFSGNLSREEATRHVITHVAAQIGRSVPNI